MYTPGGTVLEQGAEDWANYFLRVAKLRPESQGQYQTVLGGVDVVLAHETEIKHPNEWVFYEELGTSQKGSIMCVASGIAPELLFQASPDYWWDVEFIPDGHMKDSLVKVIARMTCTSEAEICGGMSNPTKSRSA
jgi:hypothetical protein